MDTKEKPIYQQIITWVRGEILAGRLRPGDRLPTVRQMTETWHCTPGTVQRAYDELARNRLVISHAGQGTHILGQVDPGIESGFQRATLVHNAETFLLEMLAVGYKTDEIEIALRAAIDRWRTIKQTKPSSQQGIIRFIGSHDPALTWLSINFPEIAPGHQLELSFSGSLGGLLALAANQADIAGSHLWDKETNSYNEAFVRRILPGKRVALVTLAQRRLGLITPPGNPAKIQGLSDLSRPGIIFVNRQAQSGTRVWLDQAIKEMGIDPRGITGYLNEKMTHSEVAAEIASGQADVGFGLETAALTYGLSFIHLVKERYDLVIPGEIMDWPVIKRLVEWLATAEVQASIESLGGYAAKECGNILWIE